MMSVRVLVEVEVTAARPALLVSEVETLLQSLHGMGANGEVKSVVTSTVPNDLRSAVVAIVRGTTDKARGFLRELAENAPSELTAVDLAARLNLPKPVSIAGLTGGLTRKQAQLMRAGKLRAKVELFSEHWDGARMSYHMSDEVAVIVLEELGHPPSG